MKNTDKLFSDEENDEALESYETDIKTEEEEINELLELIKERVDGMPINTNPLR
ncbi:MAG: hypothetical protein FWC91_13960 [Defluviitaleaceae bacterium]|nr:hypothetical protein [Defluviitaleaceae bacterium]